MEIEPMIESLGREPTGQLAERGCRIKANLENPKRYNCIVWMNAAGPISPYHLSHKPAAATFDLNQVTNHRSRSSKSVFVCAKLTFRDYFAILQCNTLYPIGHSDSIVPACGRSSQVQTDDRLGSILTD